MKCRRCCRTIGGAALSFWLLVFVLSSFLDNIAAALIGGTVARHVFQGKVHIGYLAAIVAASNAALRQCRWRHHHHHDVDCRRQSARVVEAYVAAVVAMLVFAVPASIQQQRYSPIQKDPSKGPEDRSNAGLHRRGHSDRRAGGEHHRQREISRASSHRPVLGIAVWVVIL